MMALTQAAIPTPPLNAPLGIALLTVFSFVSIVLFFLNEKYLAKDPLMDTSIFLNIKYDIAIIATTAAGFTRSNITYGLIFFFQGPCGDDPLTAGYKLIPYGIGVILTGFISGFISDKIGVRKPAVAGPIISCFGCLGLALVTRDTNFWLNAFAQFVAGLGLGTFLFIHSFLINNPCFFSQASSTAPVALPSCSLSLPSTAASRLPSASSYPCSS